MFFNMYYIQVYCLTKQGSAADKLTSALQRPKGNTGFFNFENHSMFIYIHTHTHPLYVFKGGITTIEKKPSEHILSN